MPIPAPPPLPQSTPTTAHPAAARAGSAAPANRPDRQFITALARGLQVLRCFRSGEERLGNQQLAERCQLPKSTITRLTHTLMLTGDLQQDTASGRYRLGMAALGIGGSTLARLAIKDRSRPLMQALAERSGLQITLGLRDDLAMLYVETCRGGSILTLQLDVGSRIPLAVTAMGRACLAGMAPSARQHTLARLRALDPANWPAIEAGMLQAQADLAAHGCCSAFGDWKPEIHGIAIPLALGRGLPGGNGLPDMVVSAAGPALTRSAESYLADVRPLLITLVQDIQRALAAG